MMFNDVCIIVYTFLTHSIPILWVCWMRLHGMLSPQDHVGLNYCRSCRWAPYCWDPWDIGCRPSALNPAKFKASFGFLCQVHFFARLHFQVSLADMSEMDMAGPAPAGPRLAEKITPASSSLPIISSAWPVSSSFGVLTTVEPLNVMCLISWNELTMV